MNNILSIRLMGGLGNQLFQLFATIAYGIEHTHNVVLPYVSQLHCGTVRNTYWDSFLIGLRNLTTYNQNINVTNDSLLHMPVYKERGFQYNKIPMLTNSTNLLFGYYQSYKYFDKHWDTIQNMISLKEQQLTIKNEYPDFFTDKKTISMHFRLGDYVNIQDCHPIMPVNYYYNAICNITMRHDQQYRILYFCQDIDNIEVSKMISTLSIRFPDIDFVKVDDKIEDWKQLLLMSMCSHNIIANSTYSWWAAWFNNNPNKIVCYPNIWFGPSLNHNTTDLFPPTWSKIYW